MSHLRIVIFAKAPLAGYAKTRLIPALGAECAATLAERLLRHTVEQAIAAEIGAVELCVAPDKQLAFWRTLPHFDELSLTEQVAGDLGVKMAAAAQRVINSGEKVLLIGTDCPMLNPNRLREMAEALNHHDAALYPVADGGYAALGLNDFDRSLFQNIPWSTEQVAALTRTRIKGLGWRLWQGERLQDIDEPEDLNHLPAEFLVGLSQDRQG